MTSFELDNVIILSTPPALTDALREDNIWPPWKQSVCPPHGEMACMFSRLLFDWKGSMHSGPRP